MSLPRNRTKRANRERNRRYNQLAKWEARDNGEAVKAGRSFSLVRPLEDSTAERIRIEVDELLKDVGGAVIRGYGSTDPAGITEIGHNQSRGLKVIEWVGAQTVTDALQKRIPELSEPLIMRKQNIGRFGAERGHASLAAALEDPEGAYEKEMADMQLIMCELNDWLPGVESIGSPVPHVTFATVPGGTNKKLIKTIKRDMSDIVPDELVFKPANISIGY